MNLARSAHGAALLADGTVLVAGGYPTSAGGRSAEIYSNGHWTYTGSMNSPRTGLTATRVPDGRVLVLGGQNLESTAAEYFDPAAGTWTRTGHFSVEPPISRFTQTGLGNGDVLVAAGRNEHGMSGVSRLYDPPTNSWSFASPLGLRESPTATLLRNGRVLVAGGDVNSGGATIDLSSAQLFTP